MASDGDRGRPPKIGGGDCLVFTIGEAISGVCSRVRVRKCGAGPPLKLSHPPMPYRDVEDQGWEGSEERALSTKGSSAQAAIVRTVAAAVTDVSYPLVRVVRIAWLGSQCMVGIRSHCETHRRHAFTDDRARCSTVSHSMFCTYVLHMQCVREKANALTSVSPLCSESLTTDH
jgi:hypothetical protein